MPAWEWNAVIRHPVNARQEVNGKTRKKGDKVDIDRFTSIPSGEKAYSIFFFFSNVLSFLGIFFKSHTFLLFVTTDLLLSIHLLLLGSGNFGTLLSVTSNALIIDGENSERGKLNEFQDVNM